MNTFNRFIITALLTLFASQAFAVEPMVIEIERTDETTLAITHDQPIKQIQSKGYYSVLMKANKKVYVGIRDSHDNLVADVNKTITAIAPDSNGFAVTWKMTVPEFIDMDRDNLTTIDFIHLYGYGWANNSTEYLDSYTAISLSLCYQNCSLTITSTNTFSINEKVESTTHTLTASDPAATFSIIENTSHLFKLSGTNNKILTFDGTNTDYEGKRFYTVKVKASTGDGDDKNTEQTITVTIDNVLEKTITINNQQLSVNENSPINTDVGTVNASGEITNYTITDGNNAGFFKINATTGQIQVAATGLNHETMPSYTLTIKITGTDAEDASAQITININNVDATVQKTITLTKHSIALGRNAHTVIGVLSTSNTDNANLTYSVNDTENFEITGNSLKIKTVTQATGTHPITITVSNGTQNIATQNFTITITAALAMPIVEQFTVIQNGNKGRLISKNGGTVTVSVTTSAESYVWRSELANMESNSGTTFVFDPSSLDIGTKTIKLKVTAGDLSSTRVLQLQLVASYPNDRVDVNSNGIADDKEARYSGHEFELLAGTNKKITSLANTRILLGAMGKDSGLLTLEQMKEYIQNNEALTDKSMDTLTTGDIYDYVVEGLSTAGTSAEVIIELTTATSKNAKLRKYSLVNGWSDFVVDNNNTIQSKTSTTCTDRNWQTGLITGATCLKLTIKDGGENDTDGEQTGNTGNANGVVESTISIATPISIDDDGSNSSGGGGGCVYNPNAPARFDMGFILLMTLSAYYLIRRKRRFIR
ncbi:cadherin repeat domain-containing protein [Bathymodiolus thermophilus thioautotrophic gill symbiont]|uniref:Cadherin domain-containing protein n=1 Tax=Bathymodiolus thermophilus thioautotrophic gill symbiont TaxID=2360 RepID=A0A1J5TSB9_9GAMM|nr:cadherin repeat domain-containing protein [Bathymodiolus thermophilus thioautotrophic gill symbiont]OIR23800.1 hypothetical protein BGC33_08185 [Bathymodiolus thermophilus thioautotrophic gill symbiont]